MSWPWCVWQLAHWQPPSVTRPLLKSPLWPLPTEAGPNLFMLQPTEPPWAVNPSLTAHSWPPAHSAPTPRGNLPPADRGSCDKPVSGIQTSDTSSGNLRWGAAALGSHQARPCVCVNSETARLQQLHQKRFITVSQQLRQGSWWHC